jgi:hypothetical protein
MSGDAFDGIRGPARICHDLVNRLGTSAEPPDDESTHVHQQPPTITRMTFAKLPA